MSTPRLSRIAQNMVVVAMAMTMLAASNAISMEQALPGKQPTAHDQQTPRAQPVTSSNQPARMPTRDRRQPKSHLLPAPRGPVRIIHIEGTDILIIIGGNGPGRTSGLSAPFSRVSIDAIEELDLLIIKSR